MNSLEALPSIVLAIISIALGIGGTIAMRQGYSKRLTEIQINIIDALKIEVETLQRQVSAHKEELHKATNAIDTIQYAMKKEGKVIVVNGSYITISDVQARRTIKIEMRPTEHTEGMNEEG